VLLEDSSDSDDHDNTGDDEETRREKWKRRRRAKAVRKNPFHPLGSGLKRPRNEGGQHGERAQQRERRRKGDQGRPREQRRKTGRRKENEREEKEVGGQEEKMEGKKEGGLSKARQTMVTAFIHCVSQNAGLRAPYALQDHANVTAYGWAVAALATAPFIKENNENGWLSLRDLRERFRRNWQRAVRKDTLLPFLEACGWSRWPTPPLPPWGAAPFLHLPAPDTFCKKPKKSKADSNCLL